MRSQASYIRALRLTFLFVLVVSVVLQSALIDQGWWRHGDTFSRRLETVFVRSVLDNADLEGNPRTNDVRYKEFRAVTCPRCVT